MTFKAIGSWIAEHWFFLALVVLLFVAAILERGTVDGLWFGGAMCFVISLFWFSCATLPALVFRTGISWLDWSLLAFAGAFVLLAYALGFPDLIKVGVYGLVPGLLLGLLFALIGWRQRVT